MNGTDPSQGIREPLAAAQTEARPVTRRAKGSAVAAPRLRPPTLMIDLLFGALMLFAFQMGNPNAQRIAPYEIELPTSDVRGAEDTLLGVVPSRANADGEWLYQVDGGAWLPAAEVVDLVRRQNSTLILLLSRSAPVQEYLDAEQPLRRLGLRVGLAVVEEE